MASLASFYAPAAVTGFGIADIALAKSDATADTGLAQSRLMREYATRGLPDLVNRYSSRGTVRSGGAGVAADRMKEDVGNAYGDLQRNLQRTLANLTRAGIMNAAPGVQV